MSTTQGPIPEEASPMKCGQCEEADGSLKRCAKCKTVAYCDRECQTAHWKVHKKDCARLAGLRSSGHQEASGEVPKRSDAKPFTAIYHNSFLHDRSEEETFKTLIDVIRMHQEDVYNLEGETMVGTIYNSEPTSEKAFGDFLRRAKRISGFLPPWFNDEKAEECVRYGLRSDHGFTLDCAREKSDIQEVWGDDRMPMKLRMLGEKVYGNTPGGSKGDAMLGMMMQMEGGSFTGVTSMIGLDSRRPRPM